MLKEKQQEIEMLRHERELDRQRISRLAAQADTAERNVITLKEDYDKVNETNFEFNEIELKIL